MVNTVPFTCGHCGEVTVELLLAALLVFVVSVELDLLVLLDAELDLTVLLETLVVVEELPESLVMGVVASVHLLNKSIMSWVALK